MSLSKRVSKINPSATLAITAQAKKMKAEGIDVISFGAGEPDFDTPVHIKEAAKRALDEGFTKYTSSSGIKELKQAIAEKFKKDNNLEYLAEEILVSCGAKHSIFNAILALCDEDDEVILPSPYWVSYPEMIKVSGAKSKIITTCQEGNFKITAAQLGKAVTARTKLLILNSPSNPTGMVYNKEELGTIVKIITDKNLFCISDEIYEKVIYNAVQHYSIASLGQGIKKRTIVINGVSKSYSMTGWRIGYAAGPKDIIQAMANLQSHSTSNPTSIAQKAALAALSGPQQPISEMVEEFKKRRDYIVSRMNKIDGLSCLNPQGAFYVFVNISHLFGKTYQKQKINDSLAFSTTLLSEAKVAVVPGIAFGADEYIRLSYATSLENITKGIDRIEEFLTKI